MISIAETLYSDTLINEDIISGDVMGPAIKGLRRLVNMPFGCGEQNMVLFVPNIFVLDYLTSTEKLTDDIKEECLHNMKTGTY